MIPQVGCFYLELTLNCYKIPGLSHSEYDFRINNANADIQVGCAPVFNPSIFQKKE